MRGPLLPSGRSPRDLSHLRRRRAILGSLHRGDGLLDGCGDANLAATRPRCGTSAPRRGGRFSFGGDPARKPEGVFDETRRSLSLLRVVFTRYHPLIGCGSDDYDAATQLVLVEKVGGRF